MASKVPKYGAWVEGGAQGFTGHFQKARDTRIKGPKFNPNISEETPEMLQQNNGGSAQATPSQNSPDKQRKHPTVPPFDGWEDGNSDGYTADFKNIRKSRSGGPSAVENKPEINRYMVKTQANGCPAVPKPETRDGKVTVPGFGNWESGGGGRYTDVFESINQKRDHKQGVPRVVGHPPQGGPPISRDDAKKNRNTRTGLKNSNEPRQSLNQNPDVGDKTRSPHGLKPPISGRSSQEDTANKNKNVRPGLMNFNEPKREVIRDISDKPPPPQEKKTPGESKGDGLRGAGRGLSETKLSANIEVGDKARPQLQTKPPGELKEHGLKNPGRGSISSLPGSDPAPRAPQQRGKLQPRVGPTRANAVVTPASIPPWGNWKKEPEKIEGYTEAFVKSREDRKIPLDSSAPPSYHRENINSSDKQPSCCSIL